MCKFEVVISFYGVDKNVIKLTKKIIENPILFFNYFKKLNFEIFVNLNS